MNSEATLPGSPRAAGGEDPAPGPGDKPAGRPRFRLFGVPILLLVSLGWLWFRLIDHLRVEWTVNAQYKFGWAVPFLCAYLAWNRLQNRRDHANASTRERAGVDAKTQQSGVAGQPVTWIGSRAVGFAIVVLALLYLPVRLVQEANPEWRLVSWALALIAIGITWFTLAQIPCSLSPAPSTVSSAPAPPLPLSRLLGFPLLFFLVAVPWPTVLEGPLIQGLTRANAAVTIEILNAVGIPAMQHGNLIEVGTGVVGIDEACSGIRSFQATLMLSLFFGELYALGAGRRALCVLAGFAFSFLFNVARTTLLTMVAARQGTEAIAQWHDPAGITILVGCFVCLWGLAVLLGRAGGVGQVRDEGFDKVGASERETKFKTRFQWFPGPVLLVWLILAEIGTEAWYRVHERGVAAAPAWTVDLPRSNPTYRDLQFTEKTRQFLRYDEAQNGAWQEPDGTGIQAIYLRWNPGRIAVHLAKSHTPDVCLPAAGREVVNRTDQRFVSVKGLELPFRAYTVREGADLLHVYYCLWEDRAEAQGFQTTSLSYGNRLGPVLAGRRNSGQRSLEIILRGPADETAAARMLGEQLEQLVVR